MSRVDLAIGLLTLSNRVQQTGRTDVTSAEYQLAGGPEGLLLAYVQDRLQEVPESIRAGLFRGLIFTLVDPMGIPGESERDSGMMPNADPG